MKIWIVLIAYTVFSNIDTITPQTDFQNFYQAYWERKTLYSENKTEIKLKQPEVLSLVLFCYFSFIRLYVVIVWGGNKI